MVRPVRGHIDSFNFHVISGWLAGDNPNERHFASIVIDGIEIGAARADAFRPDLKERGISDGHSGFRFIFPTLLNPLVRHNVRILDRDSGISVDEKTISPITIGGPDESSSVHIQSASLVDDGSWRLTVGIMGNGEINPHAVGATVRSFTARSSNTSMLPAMRSAESNWFQTTLRRLFSSTAFNLTMA